MTNFVDNVEFATEVCCKCAMAFAMPADFQRRRRDDHVNFFCPSGHQQHYTGPTEEQRLKNELERKTQMLEAERARAAGITKQRDDVARAHMRMRTRIMNGVCPCCNRTFQNLLRHMQTEHSGGPTLKALRETYGLTQAALAREIGVNAAHVHSHEHERPIVSWAKNAIDSWIERQDTSPIVSATKEATP